jgi:hypothetical protein
VKALGSSSCFQPNPSGYSDRPIERIRESGMLNRLSCAGPAMETTGEKNQAYKTKGGLNPQANYELIIGAECE